MQSHMAVYRPYLRTLMTTDLRNFLALSYEELEELNLEAKEQRFKRVAAYKIQEQRLKYLTDEKRIKAVTVLFSDLEGRLHMLDYDKKFILKSWDNLTFDGSSICGWGSTGALFIGRPPTISAPAKCWCSARSSTRAATPIRLTSVVC